MSMMFQIWRSFDLRWNNCQMLSRRLLGHISHFSYPSVADRRHFGSKVFDENNGTTAGDGRSPLDDPNSMKMEEIRLEVGND